MKEIDMEITNYVAMSRRTLTEIKEGDVIIDFRGKPWVFICLTPGRITAKVLARHFDADSMGQEMYSTTFPDLYLEQR